MVEDDPTATKLPVVTLPPWKHVVTPRPLALKPNRLGLLQKIARERKSLATIIHVTIAPVGIARAVKRPLLLGIAVRERTLSQPRNPQPPARIGHVDVANAVIDQPAKNARRGKSGP